MKTNDTNRNLRHIAFERDSYTCVLCSRAATDLHHVILRSQGGRNVPENVVSLCRQHHDLLHGTIWQAVAGCNGEDALHNMDITAEEAQQTVFEYVMDMYAHLYEGEG